VNVGDIIPFGGYDWRVLAIRGGAALLITVDIIEQRSYHSNTSITWENCDLRHYLNNEFYERFSQADKERIIEVTNKNPDNQWYGTPGGNDTVDKIFLLSLDEVVNYFGDSGQLKNKNPNSPFFIEDCFNEKRTANFNGELYWWLLRSPGGSDYSTAIVCYLGDVSVSGDDFFDYKLGGVRPALWLK